MAYSSTVDEWTCQWEFVIVNEDSMSFHPHILSFALKYPPSIKKMHYALFIQEHSRLEPIQFIYTHASVLSSKHTMIVQTVWNSTVTVGS